LNPRSLLRINLEIGRIYSVEDHGVRFMQRTRCNNTQSSVRKTRVVGSEAHPWADQTKSTQWRLWLDDWHMWTRVMKMHDERHGQVASRRVSLNDDVGWLAVSGVDAV
jgi:hypothetical protein